MPTAPADARLTFLAGSCPLNEDGSTAGVGDFAAKAARCIENMNVALAEAGADINDVISTRVPVASSRQADLVTAWVWESLSLDTTISSSRSKQSQPFRTDRAL